MPDAMNDAVAFMTWDRIVPWKVLALVAHPDASPVPVGFGSNNAHFAKELKRGSRIWVVSRVAKELSLSGCVTVGRIVERDRTSPELWPEGIAILLRQWRFVAIADPRNSFFLEANNAGEALKKLQISFAQNRTIVYRDAPLRDAFRRCVDQARQIVFISYRWEEGKRFARGLARRLRGAGLSPWLDALSMPAYEARGDPGVNRERLTRLIKLGIEQSAFAIAINTKTYAREGWTRMELRYIRKKKLALFQVMRGGKQLVCGQPPIVARAPEAALRLILEGRA